MTATEAKERLRGWCEEYEQQRAARKSSLVWWGMAAALTTGMIVVMGTGCREKGKAAGIVRTLGRGVASMGRMAVPLIVKSVMARV